MSIYKNLGRGFIPLVAIAVSACGRGPANENPEYAAAAERANAGLVAPLKNDTGEEIVSWVDGQVVTDWAAEIAKRERAINGYLSDTDPARAAMYGFRNGQHPQLAWSWFRDNPVGFNGNGRKRYTVRLPRSLPAPRFRPWRSPVSSRVSCRISSPSA